MHRSVRLFATACMLIALPAAAPCTWSEDTPMDLGAFSISLSVEDLAASRQFYEKLGFTQAGGNPGENWLILRNGDTVIGLFQGMFDRNTLTFNPGWNQQAEDTESFTDIRELQQRLKAQGVEFQAEVDPTTEGPGSLLLYDPDGNPVLIDQHR